MKQKIKSFSTLLFAMFLALCISSCGGGAKVSDSEKNVADSEANVSDSGASFAGIDAKIDKYGKNADFTQAEYATMLELWTEILEKLVKVDFRGEEELIKEYKEKYPKVEEYLEIISIADEYDKFDSSNKKKMEYINKIIDPD